MDNVGTNRSRLNEPKVAMIIQVCPPASTVSSYTMPTTSMLSYQLSNMAPYQYPQMALMAMPNLALYLNNSNGNQAPVNVAMKYYTADKDIVKEEPNPDIRHSKSKENSMRIANNTKKFISDKRTNENQQICDHVGRIKDFTSSVGNSPVYLDKMEQMSQMPSGYLTNLSKTCGCCDQTASQEMISNHVGIQTSTVTVLTRPNEELKIDDCKQVYAAITQSKFTLFMNEYIRANSGGTADGEFQNSSSNASNSKTGDSPILSTTKEKDSQKINSFLETGNIPRSSTIVNNNKLEDSLKDDGVSNVIKGQPFTERVRKRRRSYKSVPVRKGKKAQIEQTFLPSGAAASISPGSTQSSSQKAGIDRLSEKPCRYFASSNQRSLKPSLSLPLVQYFCKQVNGIPNGQTRKSYLNANRIMKHDGIFTEKKSNCENSFEIRIRALIGETAPFLIEQQGIQVEYIKIGASDETKTKNKISKLRNKKRLSTKHIPSHQLLSGGGGETGTKILVPIQELENGQDVPESHMSEVEDTVPKSNVGKEELESNLENLTPEFPANGGTNDSMHDLDESKPQSVPMVSPLEELEELHPEDLSQDKQKIFEPIQKLEIEIEDDIVRLETEKPDIDNKDFQIIQTDTSDIIEDSELLEHQVPDGKQENESEQQWEEFVEEQLENSLQIEEEAEEDEEEHVEQLDAELIERQQQTSWQQFTDSEVEEELEELEQTSSGLVEPISDPFDQQYMSDAEAEEDLEESEQIYAELVEQESDLLESIVMESEVNSLQEESTKDEQLERLESKEQIKPCSIKRQPTNTIHEKSRRQQLNEPNTPSVVKNRQISNRSTKVISLPYDKMPCCGPLFNPCYSRCRGFSAYTCHRCYPGYSRHCCGNGRSQNLGYCGYYYPC